MGVKKLLARFNALYWSHPLIPPASAFVALILGVVVGRLLKPVISG